MKPLKLVTEQKKICISKQGECARAVVAYGLKSAAGVFVKMNFLKAEKKMVESLIQDGA